MKGAAPKKVRHLFLVVGPVLEKAQQQSRKMNGATQTKPGSEMRLVTKGMI